MRGKRIEQALERIERALAEQASWKEIAQELRKANGELLDRLMARGFEEYKTYTFVPEDRVEKPYDPAGDEANAGMPVMVRQ